MKADDLLESMMYVEPELVEAAEVMKKKKKLWKVTAIAAACLVVVLTGLLYLRLYRFPLTAKQVLGTFHNENTLGETTMTFGVRVTTGYAPHLNPLPEPDTVPIFRRNTKEIEYDQEALAIWAEPIEQRMRGSLEDMGAQYDLVWLYDSLERRYQFSVEKSHDNTGDLDLWLDGELVELELSLDDEELLAKLAPVKERLFEIFEVAYSDVKVIRRGDTFIEVIYYDLNAHPVNQVFGTPRTDYLSISWSEQWIDGCYCSADERPSVKIRYFHNLQSPEDKFIKIGVAKLIALDEAREKLAQGYGFGRKCVECVNTQQTSCTHYDYVSFEYYSPTIPVYAFYTRVEDHYSYSGSDAYSVTYVCAVEVPGLERYLDKHFS